MALPLVLPMPLVRIPQPFDDPAWIFELKLDGFRALAFVEEGQCRLVSRNGNIFGQFGRLAASIARQLPDGVYDGEIACLDDQGRSQFNRLMFRRGTPIFAAFDLLHLEGEDLRQLPLLERKQHLAAVMPFRSSSLLYVRHIEAEGIALFNEVCKNDLEGVVGKWAKGSYCCDGEATSWVKIKNSSYSQAINRHELFHRKRDKPAKRRTVTLNLA